MEFPQAKVKSIRADLVNKEITISFTVGLNEESQRAAEDLSQYVDKDMGKVEVRIIPQQLPLKGLFPISTELIIDEEEDEGESHENHA